MKREGLVGAVLAGGGSCRFGSPKPLVSFRGEALAVRASGLQGRGCRVAAVKHEHRFHLDTPGTDSWRRTRAGATPVLLAGPEDFALFGSWGPHAEPDLETLIRTHLGDSDVVVAEGFKGEPFPKVPPRASICRSAG